MIKISEYEFDESLHYFTKSDAHMWVKKLDDGRVQTGYNDFGQKLAGKILLVRLIPVGKEKKQGAPLGTLETGKYVGALRCPVNGTVVEINQEVKDKPELINEDPYGKGWIAIIEPTNLEEDLKKDMIFGEEALKEWITQQIEAHVK